MCAQCNFSNFPFAKTHEAKVVEFFCIRFVFSVSISMDFGSLLSVAQKNAKTTNVSSEVSMKKKSYAHFQVNENEWRKKNDDPTFHFVSKPLS